MNCMSNEVLGAVHDPTAVFSDRRSARSGSIRARARFSQSPGAEMLAASQWRKILQLLRLITVLINMIRAKRIMGGDRDSDRTVYPRQLFDRGGVLDIAQPSATVFLRKQNAQQTKFGQFRLQLNRKMLTLVPFHHMRRDLAFGELAHAHFHLELFFSKFEIHLITTAPRAGQFLLTLKRQAMMPVVKIMES